MDSEAHSEGDDDPLPHESVEVRSSDKGTERLAVRKSKFSKLRNGCSTEGLRYGDQRSGVNVFAFISGSFLFRPPHPAPLCQRPLLSLLERPLP